MILLKKIIVASFCILYACLASNAQNIEAAINTYGDKYGQERIYLHYDKSSYSAGETVWFKVYLMTEIIPATESKTLYTDWLDDKGGLMHHGVSPIVDGISTGQFEIPAEYKGKFIQVKSYTKWMLNFDSAFIYNKYIRILTKEVIQPSAVKYNVAPSIQFFPEGGDIVMGLVNKIAFKAEDQWGRPVRVKGVVAANQSKIIDSIKSIHDGMGYFYLIPQPGITYNVRWKDEKGVEYSNALPAIKPAGVSMQITLAGTNRYLNLLYTPEIVTAMDSLHIVGTMYQHQTFRITRPTNSPSIKLTIPTAGLPSGILTITVFDKFWKPLTERITYVDNQEYLFKPEMEVKHWGLNKRARNEIRIAVPDSLIANLSVSITDANIGTDSTTNIISHLFLSSELKGEVYNPAWYFSQKSDSINQHLDLVMLTHGWRRFKWEEIVSGKSPKMKFARDTSYLTLSGKIYGVTPGQIQPGSAIILIVQQKNAEGKFVFTPVTAAGTFNDPSVIIFDTAHVYYQLPKAKGLGDASVQFMPDRLPSPSLNPNPVAGNKGPWPDTTGMFRQWALANEAMDLAEKLKIKTLENVTVKSKVKPVIEVMDEKYTSGLFKGDGYQFDLVNDPFSSSAMSIFTYLQGKVAGLQINTGAGTPSLQWRGGTPQLYLDEVPADPDFISSVSVNDVAFIKVFRPPFMGGFNGANGAIAIYTRRGNDVKPTPGKGLNNNKVFGYTMIKEFYSPRYLPTSPRNDERDLRTTLYWNPDVTITPQKREVVLSFYNNDVSNSFRVIIEGMTRDGRLAHIEQIME
jgi:hypothetical protein